MIRIIVSLLWANVVFAQAGQSAFALLHPKFPCTEFLLQYGGVQHPTIALLDGTFGNNTHCLRKFLALPNKKTIEIHIRYVKKNQLELLDKRLLRRRASKWEHLRRKNPENRWLLSDGLESHDSQASAKKRISYIRKFFHGEIVHNPLVPRDPRSVGADFIELHSDRYITYKGRRSIFNYDGYGINYSPTAPERDLFRTSVSSVRIDLEKAKRTNSLIFLWDAPAQGILPTRYNPDPTKRTFYNTWTFIKRDLLRQYGRIN